MLASPLTLIALLRAVAYGWQQEKIAKNAQEISELGRQLYDRIASWPMHFEEVGARPRERWRATTRRSASLESRVLVTARRLKDKGVTASEEFRSSKRSTTPRVRSAPPSWSDCSTTSRSTASSSKTDVFVTAADAADARPFAVRRTTCT